MLKIKIKYLRNVEKIHIEEQSDWIDLRSAVEVYPNFGQEFLIPLGVAIQLPKGYEAHIVPRSSTFKNFGIIQTNHMGIVDNSYCGDNDEWFFPAYCLIEKKIPKNARICQFRIVKKMEDIELEEVKKLGNSNRGGYGSTGTS